MQTSKFVRIDNNILLEYIYDSENVISEEYLIYKNTNTEVNGFLSTLPDTKNYINQKTVLINGESQDVLFTNQLVKLNTTQNQWGRFSEDEYSFIQSKNYGISIPIRYDRIRVWVPVNYTFEDLKGFHLRVYTLDFNNQKWIDLSNYFFDISDTNQSDEIEYSNPPIYQFEMNWGKYFEIQFPSPNKVSDQRINNVTKENTINFNLSDGVGLSKDAPVFVDFYFIESIKNSTQLRFYNLINKQSLSFPSTPEYEKFSIVIEPSKQGDFFLIYPEKNGSIGEFNQFIEESIVLGNRYFLEWTITTYEKNIKVDEQKLIITENFIEEIEFRPIFKWTTTTAIIDVECKLIDAVNGHENIRKASYALLQDEVSNYSRYLSKIDLSKAEKIDVYKIKGIETPNLDSATYNPSQLKIKPNSYVVYSREYFLAEGNQNINYLNKNWFSDKQQTIEIFPYDNIFKFNLISKNEFDNFREMNLSSYEDILLSFKSDNKNLEFEIWRDSDSNNPELGQLVFKIPMDKVGDIKRIFNDGFTSFYISGTKDNNKQKIYTGVFNIWEDTSNINKLNDLFERSKNAQSSKQEKTRDEIESKQIESIRQEISNENNTQTSTITTGEKQSDAKRNAKLNKVSPIKEVKNLQNDIYNFWQPYWRGDFEVMLKAYEYGFEGSDFNKFKLPSDVRLFGIRLTEAGILSQFSLNKSTGLLDDNSQTEINLILGYFKIFNFNPNDKSIIDWIGRNDNDLESFLSSDKSKPLEELQIGSNVPPTQEVVSLIKKQLKKKEEVKINPKFQRIQKSFDLKIPFKINNNI